MALPAALLLRRTPEACGCQPDYRLPAPLVGTSGAGRYQPLDQVEDAEIECLTPGVAGGKPAAHSTRHGSGGGDGNSSGGGGGTSPKSGAAHTGASKVMAPSERAMTLGQAMRTTALWLLCANATTWGLVGSGFDLHMISIVAVRPFVLLLFCPPSKTPACAAIRCGPPQR